MAEKDLGDTGYVLIKEITKALLQLGDGNLVNPSHMEHSTDAFSVSPSSHHTPSPLPSLSPLSPQLSPKDVEQLYASCGIEAVEGVGIPYKEKMKELANATIAMKGL